MAMAIRIEAINFQTCFFILVSLIGIFLIVRRMEQADFGDCLLFVMDVGICHRPTMRRTGQAI
jgi:hypothetical protein